MTIIAKDATVRQILNEHLSGKRDHTLRLWQLVVFERWHRAYVDNSFPFSTPALPLDVALPTR